MDVYTTELTLPEFRRGFEKIVGAPAFSQYLVCGSIDMERGYVRIKSRPTGTTTSNILLSTNSFLDTLGPEMDMLKMDLSLLPSEEHKEFYGLKRVDLPMRVRMQADSAFDNRYGLHLEVKDWNEAVKETEFGVDKKHAEGYEAWRLYTEKRIVQALTPSKMDRFFRRDQELSKLIAQHS